MSRRFQFSMGFALVAAAACCLAIWSPQGCPIILGGAIGAAAAAAMILVYRNKPVGYSTRKLELRWLPVYCVEMLIAGGISLLVISGGGVLEIAVGTIGLVFITLKAAAHIYIWLTIPPTMP